MILTAEPIDARRALEYGIVNAVIPRADLEVEVEAVARRLVALRQHALRSVKRSMREGADLPLRDAIRLERRLALRTVTA
jgi:enoyl-CoA hydratase/carnithine racemase